MGSLDCLETVNYRDVGSNIYFCDQKPVLGSEKHIYRSSGKKVVAELVPVEHLYSLGCEADDFSVEKLQETLGQTLSIDADNDDLYEDDDALESSEEASYVKTFVSSLIQKSHIESAETAALCDGLDLAYMSPDENDLARSGPSIVCARSTKDTSPVIYSAMRGSRAQRGIILESKLRVTWAPEVYDPPVTSDSHTLRGWNRQRPKAYNKDHYKQKAAKGRSSRGKNDKKHDKKHIHSSYGRGSYSTSTSTSRSSDLRMSRSYSGHEKAKMQHPASLRTELVAGTSKSSEVTCWSSCCAEPLAPSPLQLPLAEAS